MFLLNNNSEGREKLNFYGKTGIPVFFIIDFESINPIIIPVTEALKENILFNINGFQNHEPLTPGSFPILRKYPVSYPVYKKSFDYVQSELRKGNSYLVNLTFPSRIESEADLLDIYSASNARYKLYYRGHFVIFSPESFIQIRNNRIRTFPMKGTINAKLPGAGQILLTDPKENAEHATIVDLLRNDLSMVAEKVKVKRFKYLDIIETKDTQLLQMSSEITGKLINSLPEKTGDLIYSLLPAGSVTGAPKMKTLEIIRNSEICKRGFYTGIFGYFDGKYLDSGVMIRFIEKTEIGTFYHSGGGITVNSVAEKEYTELIDKIYVPVI